MTRSTIELSGLPGRGLDVNLQLHITHTYDADLEVYLQSTSGRRVELFTGRGWIGRQLQQHDPGRRSDDFHHGGGAAVPRKLSTDGLAGRL